MKASIIEEKPVNQSEKKKKIQPKMILFSMRELMIPKIGR